MLKEKAIRLTPADMQAIDSAITFIHREYRSKISAENLSIEVNLPKEKIQAGIQQKTSYSLHQYLLRVRIEKAKELLIKTNAPVKSIGPLTGFPNHSHFCQVFKRITEISPAIFRLREVG